MNPLKSRLNSAGLALALVASAASAHTVMVPDAAKPGAAYVGAFRVSHGCDGSATTALRVEIPAGVASAKPQAKAGWTVEIEREPLATPLKGEGGKPITTRVKAITWRGVLPDDEFDTFGIMLKLPAAEGPLYLPTVQTCEKGAHRWTDIPAPGQAWHSVPSPAPVITIGQADPAARPKGISVTGGWTRKPPPGAPAAAGYATIVNGGPGDDRLLGGTSPIATRVEVHRMSMAGGIMVMRPEPGGLAIPAGSSVSLAPGGLHLMLIGPKTYPPVGETVPVILEFEHAGKITVPLQVVAQGASAPGEAMDHDHMGEH